MNQTAKISLNQITEKLEVLPYAYALWRMPKSSECVFIVSLTPPVQKKLPIGQLSTGFVFNRFDENHPVAPYHISADLLFRGNDLTINSDVSSSQVDKFIEEVKSLKDESCKTDFHKASLTNSDSFENLVEQAVSEIKSNRFEKVVLARHEDQYLPEGFSLLDYFNRISEKYPNAFVSLVHIPGENIWIGASPELLMSDNGSQFRTIALAGTKSLLPDQTLSEIAWTQKEIEEQAFVSRYIINCFKKIRLREFDEKGPKTVQAGNLAHLKTEFVVDYEALGFENLSEQMLELLHPTSAVCGMPLDAAKKYISDSESFDRSFYSGFLGPVNFDGLTTLFVNLRCARIKERVIRFYAGAGITEDSIPSHEKEETILKMSVLKQLL